MAEAALGGFDGSLLLSKVRLSKRHAAAGIARGNLVTKKFPVTLRDSTAAFLKFEVEAGGCETGLRLPQQQHIVAIVNLRDGIPHCKDTARHECRIDFKQATADFRAQRELSRRCHRPPRRDIKARLDKRWLDHTDDRGGFIDGNKFRHRLAAEQHPTSPQPNRENERRNHEPNEHCNRS